MNATDEKLLDIIVTIDDKEETAVNIRKNGQLLERKITESVTITSKKDVSGIDIYVKENAKNALVLIPVIVTETGLDDMVYNDFYIGKNATAIIMAGCGIDNPGSNASRHQGIHRFFVEEGANIKYIEKHCGTGHGKGEKVLNPVTEISLKKNATMHIDTVQIEGVSSSIRTTKATLEEGSTLTIGEKIKTHNEQYAKTDFEIDLNGENSHCHIISRSVATNNSKQEFLSYVNGNNNCYAHIECDAIIKDHGIVKAIPAINANHVDARLVHEATIGKIAGEQLIKLMTLGLSNEEAECEIINGFLK